MIYDQPITRQEQRQLPQVSLNEKHKYVKDSAFQTSFTGKLTDKAIHKYALQGRYGTVVQAHAQREEAAIHSAKNVKKSLIKTLANKYVNL